MNLLEYRKFRFMSVQQVSKEIGVSRQHIYDIEKGKAFPSRKLSIKINEWSGGLVTRRELLFPDEIAPVKGHLVDVKKWDEKERQDIKDNFHNAFIIGDETYTNIC